jgi:hypothetical protein
MNRLQLMKIEMESTYYVHLSHASKKKKTENEAIINDARCR